MADQPAPSPRRPPDAESRYQRLLETQTLLAQVSRQIGSALELQPVLKTVLETMRSLVDFRGGSVCLIDGDQLRIEAADPEVSDDVRQLRLPLGQGLAGRAAHAGVSIYSPDIAADDRVVPAVRETGTNRQIRSYLAVPLVTLGNVVGVLQVDSTDVDAFDDEDRRLLEGLAVQVAGAIESAKRYELIMELEVLKNDFIARVSHELRTPITIMAGFLSTLMTHHDVLDADDRRRMLERIDVATARLSGLIDQLLTMSRVEAGIIVAQPEVVALSPVLEQVRREAESPDRVAIDCPDDLEVETDPTLLVRALGFLVDNALKYGGGAEVRARAGTIEVLDHGPGISDENRTRVFELFTRSTQHTTIPGMGLGLPLARTLVATLGAELSHEDAEGGGTRMVIHLSPSRA